MRILFACCCCFIIHFLNAQNPQSKILYPKKGPFHNVWGLQKYGKMSRAHVEGKMVILDAQERIISPILYEYIDYFDAKGFARVHKNGKMGVVDTNFREKIPCLYKYISRDEQTGFWMYQTYPHPDSTAFEHQKWGYLNQDFKAHIPPIYTQASGFVHFSQKYAVVSLNGKFGAIDTNGRVCIPFQYDAMQGNKPVPTYQIGKKVGLLDTFGRELTPAFCDWIRTENMLSYKVGKYTVEYNIGGKSGLLNRFTGEQITEAIYGAYAPIRYLYTDSIEQILVIKTETQKGLLDMFGRELLPAEYLSIYKEKENSEYIWIYKDLKNRGILFPSKDFLMPITYEDIRILNKNNLIIAVQKDKKWGLYDMRLPTNRVLVAYPQYSFLGGHFSLSDNADSIILRRVDRPECGGTYYFQTQLTLPFPEVNPNKDEANDCFFSTPKPMLSPVFIEPAPRKREKFSEK